MRIVVLGGAGKMGCISVQSLTKDPRVDEVVIADFNLEQAKVVAETIDSAKISIEKVDVNDHDGLVKVLEGADACLNATVYYTNLQIMEACLEAGVSYTDMGGLFHTTLKQLELSDRFAEKGLSAVLGMGSAPGIPNIQSRYAADRLDTLLPLPQADPEDRAAEILHSVQRLRADLVLSLPRPHPVHP